MKLFSLTIVFFVSTILLQAQTLTSSNLPIVILITNGSVINDSVKVTVAMSIIDNGSGVDNNVTDVPTIYNGNCGLE